MNPRDIKLHHVVPQSLRQLLVSFHSEVETICCEEAHIDFPVLSSQK